MSCRLAFKFQVQITIHTNQNGSKLKAQMSYRPIRFQVPITTHTSKMGHNCNVNKTTNA